MRFSDYEQHTLDEGSGPDYERTMEKYRMTDPAKHYHRIETGDLHFCKKFAEAHDLSIVGDKEHNTTIVRPPYWDEKGNVLPDVYYLLTRLEGQIVRLNVLQANEKRYHETTLKGEMASAIKSAEDFAARLRAALHGERYDVT